MAKKKLDPIWDVICELFSLDPQTKIERARINRVKNHLRAKRATKIQIRAVYQRCCQEWQGKTFSPEALLKWYDQFKAAPKQERPLPPAYVPTRVTTDAERVAEIRRWMRETGGKPSAIDRALLARLEHPPNEAEEAQKLRRYLKAVGLQPTLAQRAWIEKYRKKGKP